MIETRCACNALFMNIGLVLSLALFACTSSGDPLTNTAPLPPAAPNSYREAAGSPAPWNFSGTAIDFVADLKAGWNLGNTLDAYVSGQTGLATQTSWGQPLTTRAMMAGLKSAGIQTVRIPVTWHNHVDAAFTIDDEWMDRVVEVVGYALDEGLYAIINIHHDDKPGYIFPDAENEARSTEYVRRIWKQIALMFRNHDERLIFELLNEPRLAGRANEWNWSDSDSKHRDAARIIGEMSQAALDEIRASGGNNQERFVMITPYVASPWAALSSHFVIPTDTVADRLILSVHAYTPYVFAMQNPGDIVFSDSHKRDIDSFMDQLDSRFIQARAMPVIIGEYGATNKNNLEQRVAWFSYFCTKAAGYGMSTVLWDNGNYIIPPNGSFNELYGFYNRSEQSWYFPEILNAIIGAFN